MIEEQAPETEREVSNAAIMRKLDQMELLLVDMSRAIVEIHRTLSGHLDSHEHDAKILRLADGGE